MRQCMGFKGEKEDGAWRFKISKGIDRITYFL